MKFTIREATIKDMPSVLNLIKELAAFEKEPDAVEVTVNELEKEGFGDHAIFKCFVAEVNEQIAGTAIIFDRFSTWKGRIVHLEDLIVKEDMRNHGIGTALLDEVVKHAFKKGVKRINWEVLNWNKGAIKLYELKGAKVLYDWNVVHMDENAIKNYISNLD